LRGGGDVFRGAELIEIIVAAVDLFIGDRPIKSVFLVALGGIKIGAGVRQIDDVGQTLGIRRIGRQCERAGCAGQYGAAAESQMVLRGKAVGNFPTAAANNVHGAGSQNPRPRGTGRSLHWQVTVMGKLKACVHGEKSLTRPSSSGNFAGGSRAGASASACRTETPCPT